MHDEVRLLIVHVLNLLQDPVEGQCLFRVHFNHLLVILDVPSRGLIVLVVLRMLIESCLEVLVGAWKFKVVLPVVALCVRAPGWVRMGLLLVRLLLAFAELLPNLLRGMHWQDVVLLTVELDSHAGWNLDETTHLDQAVSG